MRGWFDSIGRLVAVSDVAVGFDGPEPVTMVQELPIGAEAALGRAFLQGDGSIVVYDPLNASVLPNPVPVNSTVTVTATLPVGSPDAQVTFQAEGGGAYQEPVVNGQAAHAYAFAAAGNYRIAVSSAHHGTAYAEVTVQ